jgi:hypothetical protein
MGPKTFKNAVIFNKKPLSPHLRVLLTGRAIFISLIEQAKHLNDTFRSLFLKKNIPLNCWFISFNMVYAPIHINCGNGDFHSNR